MISLIIVDYKSIPKTIEYIDSCYTNILDSHKFCTIIVDNSEDSAVGLQYLNSIMQNSMELIKTEQFKELASNLTIPDTYRCIYKERLLIYICAKENLGYAKGNNLGAKISDLFLKNPYYIFSNNDLIIPKPFFAKYLLKPMKENNRIAIVGPNIINPAGQEQNPKKRKSYWTLLFLYYFEMLLPKKLQKESYISDIDNSSDSKVCDWVSGSFFCVDAAKFWEAKGFDEYTFLFAEELIISKRLDALEYLIYYCKDLKLIHEHGKTVKSTLSELKSIRISFESVLYYYVEYEKINKIIIVLARINFILFTILFVIKKRITRLKIFKGKGKKGGK